MATHRKPYTVDSTAANTLTLFLHFIGFVLIINGVIAWGLYAVAAGLTVYGATMVHEHLTRTYPHQEGTP